MLCADPRDPALWAGKLFLVPFFCFHYGMFTAIHGSFVFRMLGGKRYDTPGLAAARAGRARRARTTACGCRSPCWSRATLFSFLWNYLYRGEFRRAQLAALMAQPYGRVVVLHVAIILGGIRRRWRSARRSGRCSCCSR